MKYKQLPSEKLIQKLIATSFNSPSKNRNVYDWGNEVLHHIKFLENERIKLVQKYGKDDGKGNLSVLKEKYNDFFKEFKEILEMELNEEVPVCPISEDWFDDDCCQYSSNKEMWLTPAEIGMLIDFNK